MGKGSTLGVSLEHLCHSSWPPQWQQSEPMWVESEGNRSAWLIVQAFE